MYTQQIVDKPKDYYGLKLFLGLFFLILILAYTSLHAIQNYYPSSIFSFGKEEKKIYFLESNTLENMYAKMDMDYDIYSQRIHSFESIADEYGYTSYRVKTNNLLNIDKNSVVLILDMVSLSSKEINDIDTFVKMGGKVLLNFTSGFLNESFSYQKNNLVSRVTDLKLSKKHNTLKFQKKDFVYLSTRLLSPITQYLPEGHGLPLSLYDALPIFNTAQEADGYLTNWSQTRHVSLGENKELSSNESGLIWHGTKAKGKWVYFSFPSYVFTEGGGESFKKLFRGMLTYLNNQINVQLYPYIDAKNAVFISEDTEYKYENLKQFYNISKKYNFPVTAFCVANLALKHKSLMKKVAKDKNIEIGSHSYTHEKIVGEKDEVYEKETIGSKKVLNQFSKEDLIGFRAPREEVDDKMIRLLEGANYKYILSAAENRLYPYYNDEMLIFPKHATDDYSFLINLDWNSNQILEVMKKEVETLARLDGVYTLSTHTHLMTFGSNIKILDKFFRHVKQQKKMTPMNGKMLYERVSKRLNISTESVMTENKLILTISNDNTVSVNDVHFEVVVDPSMQIKGIESEIIGLKTTIQKKTKNTYLLKIGSLKPKSQIVLFIKYDSFK